MPTGQSSAALGLLRLAALTGDTHYEDESLGALKLIQEIAPQHPQAFGNWLQALDFYIRPTREVALAGDDVARSAKSFVPDTGLASWSPDHPGTTCR